MLLRARFRELTHPRARGPRPPQADESRLLHEPLARSVAQFLKRRAKELPAGATDTACVSLSGGVDSMVLCRILSRLGAARSPGAPRRVVALHIDYGNRPESAAEAGYVRRWCEREGVEFRERRIEEVRRGVTDRDEYERESRRIRYEFYQAELRRAGARAVFVGHHRGDVQENIVTNVMRARVCSLLFPSVSFLWCGSALCGACSSGEEGGLSGARRRPPGAQGSNLLMINGMSEESVVNGVLIWRAPAHPPRPPRRRSPRPSTRRPLDAR